MWALRFTFTSGRYHATPWGHHVNEGLVEWPPSPWRIARALVAGAHSAFREGVPDECRALILRLAETLPEYRLPASCEAHRRHYVPLDGLSGGLPKTARMLDAFRVLAGGAGDPEAAITVFWPGVELSSHEVELLDRIVEHLGFLGRAESRTVVERIEVEEFAEFDATPSEEDGSNATLFASQSDAAIRAWQDELPKQQRRAAPADLWEALHLDTAAMRAAGWSRPPGTRSAPYRMTEPRTPTLRSGTRMHRRVRHVAYTLTSRVPPSIEHALRIGERMRTALLAWTDGHSLVAGKGVDGRPLGGHEHARIIPLDEDLDGRIDQIVVTFGVDIDLQLERSLAGPSRGARLWGNGVHDLELAVVQTWTMDELLATPELELPSCLRMAQRWESSTPYVLSRHPKRRSSGRPRPDLDGLWRDGPEEQLFQDIERSGLPAPAKVEWLEGGRKGARRTPWHRFDRTRRSGKGSRGPSTGFGFVVEFPEPVRGPLAFGYGAHFGLGQFRPTKPATE
jgi:CRISPR-associated protein Csb2